MRGMVIIGLLVHIPSIGKAVPNLNRPVRFFALYIILIRKTN